MGAHDSAHGHDHHEAIEDSYYLDQLCMVTLSAAFGGPWVERRGPRAAATASALFFGGGLLLAGLGLRIGSPVLLLLGAGLVGGIGCGLGYIAPVSSLVK